MKYLIPLLLAGCAYTPIEELENQLFECDRFKEDCEVIREQVEKRHRAREQRDDCDPWAKCYYGQDIEWLLREY